MAESRTVELFSIAETDSTPLFDKARNAREWILENQAGTPVFRALRNRARTHKIEQVGAELRKMMSWLKK